MKETQGPKSLRSRGCASVALGPASAGQGLRKSCKIHAFLALSPASAQQRFRKYREVHDFHPEREHQCINSIGVAAPIQKIDNLTTKRSKFDWGPHPNRKTDELWGSQFEIWVS